MDDEKDTYKKQYKDISVKTTDGSTLTGKVNLGQRKGSPTFSLKRKPRLSYSPMPNIKRAPAKYFSLTRPISSG